MCKESCHHSALFIDDGDDGVAVVLVMGGCGGTGKEAALLTNRPHQTTAAQANRNGQWRWQQLSPMLKKRYGRPGLLLLGEERVLVCGGYNGSKSAEILKLPRADNDKGVWTLLTQKMTQDFWTTFIVKFNHRIVAVGEFHINMVVRGPKQHLFNIIHLHCRL